MNWPRRAAGPLRTACEPADGRAVGWAEAPQGEVLYDVRIEDGTDPAVPVQVRVVPQPRADA